MNKLERENERKMQAFEQITTEQPVQDFVTEVIRNQVKAVLQEEVEKIAGKI